MMASSICGILRKNKFLHSLKDTIGGGGKNLGNARVKYIKQIAFSPDGNILVSATEYDIRTWDLSDYSLQKLQELDVRESNWYGISMAISPNLDELATGEDSGNVNLSHVSNGKNVDTLEGLLAPVSSIAFSSDGKQLAAGAWDGSIRLWDVVKGKQLRLLQGPTGDLGKFNATFVAFSMDGRWLASVDWNKTFCIWDLRP
jgi:WD40 repeat protein